jgi:hypothetical protein
MDIKTMMSDNEEEEMIVDKDTEGKDDMLNKTKMIILHTDSSSNPSVAADKESEHLTNSNSCNNVKPKNPFEFDPAIDISLEKYEHDAYVKRSAMAKLTPLKPRPKTGSHQPAPNTPITSNTTNEINQSPSCSPITQATLFPFQTSACTSKFPTEPTSDNKVTKLHPNAYQPRTILNTFRTINPYSKLTNTTSLKTTSLTTIEPSSRHKPDSPTEPDLKIPASRVQQPSVDDKDSTKFHELSQDEMEIINLEISKQESKEKWTPVIAKNSAKPPTSNSSTLTKANPNRYIVLQDDDDHLTDDSSCNRQYQYQQSLAIEKAATNHPSCRSKYTRYVENYGTIEITTTTNEYIWLRPTTIDTTRQTCSRQRWRITTNRHYTNGPR